TVIIAVFGLIIGFIIGSIVAVIKEIPTYKNPILKIIQRIGDLYVTIFRGTPMVVQLLIIHFVLFPAMRIQFKNLIITQNFSLQGVVIEAIIAFALNSGAYMSEIMRGGISSIDKGQLEAGRALGLSYPKTMVSVVLPQAFKNVLPTLGNEFIALIKETSVVSFIAVTDLTKAFQNIANSTYEFIIPYLVLALCYLVLVILISILVKFLEKKLKKA
ncbi:MAG: amino acid ABC transporter permease, partial [Clostridia bacterium]|nr:amino acid ABC transporter permease [Clostridia bacterium]